MASIDPSLQKSNGQDPEKYVRILDAALQIFARKGFHDTKVTEVARSAGVADGTIYLYFKNKDDLLASLFEAKLEAINADLDREIADLSTPQEQIERFIRFHLEMASKSPALAVLVTVEARRRAGYLEDYARQQLDEYLARLSAIIDSGKDAGVFRPDVSTTVLGHLVFGALDHTCQEWMRDGNDGSATLETIGGQLTDLVLRAISAQS